MFNLYDLMNNYYFSIYLFVIKTIDFYNSILGSLTLELLILYSVRKRELEMLDYVYSVHTLSKKCLSAF